mgnify:CR=1 FL=1
MPAPLAHDQFGTRVRVLQWIRHQLGWRCLCAWLQWWLLPFPIPLTRFAPAMANSLKARLSQVEEQVRLVSVAGY